MFLMTKTKLYYYCSTFQSKDRWLAFTHFKDLTWFNRQDDFKNIRKHYCLLYDPVVKWWGLHRHCVNIFPYCVSSIEIHLFHYSKAAVFFLLRSHNAEERSIFKTEAYFLDFAVTFHIMRPPHQRCSCTFLVYH